MKTIRNYFFIAIAILGLISCEKHRAIAKPIPFEFIFSSFGGPVQGDTSCGELPLVLIRQEGGGENIILGKFTFASEFCNNLMTFEYFGNSSSFGYFLAEDGDQLNIVFDQGGQIVPTSKEGYDFMFQDPFKLEGGTGKFKYATGTGTTDSYVILAEGRTDHRWTGTILFR